MKVEQIHSEDSEQVTYYIESGGEVAIIDPVQDPYIYVQQAEQTHARIKYIFGTYLHVDFAGTQEVLAEHTGAKIIYGSTAQPAFNAYVAADDEMFILGDVRVKVIHTPGHTLESCSFLLIDEDGNDYAIFTGELPLDETERPLRMMQADSDVRKNEELMGKLYDSLQKKIIPLEDKVIVYPKKHFPEENWDTLGYQKRNNQILRPNMSKEEFMQRVL